MSDDGTLGLLLVLAALLVATGLIERAPWKPRLKRLVIVGLWLRVAGALAYLMVFETHYGGGDYESYYKSGLTYSAILLDEGAGAFIDTFPRRWWGTPFTTHCVGAVLSFIGPTLTGTFLVFAALSYVGILGIIFAFAQAFPQADWRRYVALVVLFPSLWFWPAALGKDALVLCGIGLATLGFVGNRSRPRWFLLALGLALVFCIRPQVAATVVFALVAGFWLAGSRKWTANRVFQGLLLLAVGVSVIILSGGALGVELFNPDQVEGYLDKKASVSTRGGSAIEGGASPWLAPVNTLFRPFPWEARGVTSLLAAGEVFVLWGLAWVRRRQIAAFVRTHRKSRLFWMALVFIVVYSTALGMAIGNVGIIARQRVHVLPFLFMFIAGAPTRRERTAPARQAAPGRARRTSLTLRPLTPVP